MPMGEPYYILNTDEKGMELEGFHFFISQANFSHIKPSFHWSNNVLSVIYGFNVSDTMCKFITKLTINYQCLKSAWIHVAM